MALFEERYARSRLAAVCALSAGLVTARNYWHLNYKQLPRSSSSAPHCCCGDHWDQRNKHTDCTAQAATLQYPTPNFLVAGHDTMQNTAGRVKTFETLWGELRMKFVAYRIGFNSTLSFKDSYQDTSWCMHQVINIQYTKHRDEGVAEVRCQFII